jgi:ribosome maturation factor RimP
MQLAVAVVCRRESTTLNMRARVRVNVCARFSEIILRVCDTSNTGSQTSYNLSTMSDGTWAELSHDENNAGWGQNVRLEVTAKGTTNPNNVGETAFWIEWIRVEL